MKQIKLLAVLMALVLLCTSATKQKTTTTIFIIGDSTAAKKDLSKGSPERGWGMALQCYFDDSFIHVDNHAVNGRSSKSFIDEGRWQKVLDKMQPGDYVIIQFGHNDEKPQPARHTEPGSTFDANLAKFVNETRAKGGIPILMNPVVRRNFAVKRAMCWLIPTGSMLSLQGMLLTVCMFSLLMLPRLPMIWSRAWVLRIPRSCICGINQGSILPFLMVNRTIPITIFTVRIRWLVCWLMPYARRFLYFRSIAPTTNPARWNSKRLL